MGHYTKNYSKYCFATICLNLSVFALVGANSKCATLYSSSSHQGNPISLVDGAKLPNLPYKNYVPQSVRVTPGCFLTILDVYGNRQTLDKDYNNLGRSVSALFISSRSFPHHHPSYKALIHVLWKQHKCRLNDSLFLGLQRFGCSMLRVWRM